jgi:hypothetical protein
MKALVISGGEVREPLLEVSHNTLEKEADKYDIHRNFNRKFTDFTFGFE